MDDLFRGSLGDAALEIAVPPGTAAEMVARARHIADAVEAAAPDGVTDVVPAVDRVTVVYDPALPALVADLASRVRRACVTPPRGAPAATCHEIPVCYEGDCGPDLDEVCRRHGIDAETFVRLHTAAEYLVEAIGFTPGFAYLHGLPDTLATPRRATPRPLVPAGSVGIGGARTGVYPSATPGGWNIVGRSPARLFDTAASPACLLRAGDALRFVAITPAEFAAATAIASAIASASPPTRVATAAGVVVEAPGLFSTVQDLGRPGWRAAGVPLSGAADQASLRVANLLVGNPETAAGMEFTLVGPSLFFERDAVVAVAGGDFTGFPRWQAVAVAAGTKLSLGRADRGCRGCLAIGGGIDLPTVLGSASTYEPAALGGLHGRRLAAGDRLPIGAGGRGRQVDPRLAAAVVPDPETPCTLRIIPTPESAALGDTPWRREYRASARSDRMGVRLDGATLLTRLQTEARAHPLATGLALSRPVLPGSVQLPPDGRPIILLADAQTMGGYPLLGQVVAADLRLAAQLRPGHPVRLRPCTLDEARAAATAAAARLEDLRRGLGFFHTHARP